ncbi:MAG: 3-dehydroquinate synthase [Clostridia bacterium]|nr:3-dehydroquinate synthase [Clostridia bacterium]
MLKLKQSEILIENGAINHAGELLSQITKSNRCAVVSDTNVAPLYLDKLKSILRSAGFTVVSYIIPAGEASKTLATVEKIYTFLANENFIKTDAIIALGGGVIGDITGFVAATYLRGISSMQIPTSLLAQVDSSVGGKCGVDLPAGKNMVGAFHQPLRVVIDPDLLTTLPEHFVADGMAEVIKYGAIFDEQLLEKIEKEKISTDIIRACVTHKRDVVVRDEFDNGERMLLNFGHTAAHSIEAIGNYTKHTHGFAVSIGMIYAARLGEKLGLTESGTALRLANILKSVGLPTELPYEEKAILEHMLNDKKMRNGKLNIILLDRLGLGKIVPFSPDEVINFNTCEE